MRNWTKVKSILKEYDLYFSLKEGDKRVYVVMTKKGTQISTCISGISMTEIANEAKKITKVFENETS